MLIDLHKLSTKELSPSNEFETKVLQFLKEWFLDSKKVEIQSSGSTGKPKIFSVEKLKMLNSAKMTCNFLNLQDENSALLCLPIEYISGKMMVVRSIVRNLKLKIVEPSTRPLEKIDSVFDFCAMTPLQVENSLDKLHLIRKLIIGGASVSEILKNKISAQLIETNADTQIFETYGMSETLSHIALKQIFPQQEEWFTIFEDIEIALDDRNCLKIFAPQLNDDILQTNDLVEIKDQNKFRFLGRLDNVINSGGAKIFPEVLEKILKKSIVNEVVFFGITDEQLGQKLIAVVEGERDDAVVSTINNINYEKSFHKPKEIIFVKQIPRTENGKVNRPRLLEIMNLANQRLQ